MNNATEQDLIGVISAKNDLRGSISNEQEVCGAVATVYTTGAAAYEGDYEITPTTETQKLKTKQRYMTKDVTVYAVPYFETSNHAGGETVYIASDVDIEG